MLQLALTVIDGRRQLRQAESDAKSRKKLEKGLFNMNFVFQSNKHSFAFVM